ncbi:STAS domain-containing protein [Streptomyces sp. NPDC047928]|uniref:STAS domain-containing protein n=1 Tax=unclassified Streptomyces TaxID=2593676 RepID=UPI00371AF2DB
MRTTPIALTEQRLDDVTVTVALSGELDYDTAGRIGPTLERLVEDRLVLGRPAGGREGELLLNMSGITFCDSSGVELLLRLQRRCAEAGARLRLCQVPRRPGRVIRTLGVHRSVPCSFT